MARTKKRPHSQPFSDMLNSDMSQNSPDSLVHSQVPSQPLSFPNFKHMHGQGQGTSVRIQNPSSQGNTQLHSKVLKKGRGPSRYPIEWNTGKKLNVTLNNDGQIIGPDYKKVVKAMGILAKNGVKLPLHYEKWSVVEMSDFHDAVWKDIQANTTLPPESKKGILSHVGMMWKQWKYQVKKDHYIPHQNDDEYLLKLPNDRLVLAQWLDLVRYWKREDIQDKAQKNAGIVKLRKYPHRTGRLPFHLLTDQLTKSNTSLSILDIFLASRKMGNGIQDDATSLICSLIEEELQKKPESERTKEFKDELFANAIGLVRNGRVRCMGRGITLSKLRANSKNALKDIANQQEDIQKQMEEINHEKEVLNEVRDELSSMKADMIEYLGERKQEMDQYKHEVEEEREFLKLERDQLRIQMKSVEQALGLLDSSIFHAVRSPLVVSTPNRDNDILIQNGWRSCEQPMSTTGYISNNNENQFVPSSNQVPNFTQSELQELAETTFKVGEEVLLLRHRIPKKVVAIGVVISMAPTDVLFEVPLGPDFWKVYIKKVIEPDYHLMRPYRGTETVGQALKKYVAWHICDVMEK